MITKVYDCGKFVPVHGIKTEPFSGRQVKKIWGLLPCCERPGVINAQTLHIGCCDSGLNEDSGFGFETVSVSIPSCVNMFTTTAKEIMTEFPMKLSRISTKDLKI